MEAPQFKGKDVSIYNEKTLPLYEKRLTDRRALAGLHISQTLLCVGIVLILLNNLDVLSSGSYFGSFNWLTVAIFSLGIVINFVSIPYLYFSSFTNFKKEDDFWDRETFWILPLFFFGTFFIYGSHMSLSALILMVSVAVILSIHLRFVRASWKIASKNFGRTLSSYQQYNTTLKYLTAYYLLILTLLVIYDPLKHALIWVRLHT